MVILSDLPRDLVEMILSRVPITSLGAVRCTHKQWNAISKYGIICKAEARQQFAGFMMKEFRLCSVKFDLHIQDVEPSINEIGIFNQLEISNVFHCDGLLLCVTKEDIPRLVVWNPYLGQTRWIKPRNSYHMLDRYAIGYDDKKNHKILRFYDECVNRRITEHEIYDFKSDSWRVLDVTPHWRIDFYQRGVSLKGNTYFLTKDRIVLEEDANTQPVKKFLFCFDFTRESFGKFLHVPFHVEDIVSLTSLRDEKLAVLSQSIDEEELGIWITTKIEPIEVSWSHDLFQVRMETPSRFQIQIEIEASSFFIDQENKVTVLFDLDESENRWYNTAYIFGENELLKKVNLGQAVNHREESRREEPYCCPLLCSSSYVPSLVQLDTIAGGKRKRKKRKSKSKRTN